MEVTFAAHYLEESAGFGMARYSRNLVDALRASGVKVKTLQCDPRWHSGIKSGIDFFLSIPAKSVLDGSKSVFHLAAPQAGISAPLVKMLRGRRVVSTIYDITPLLPGHQRLSTAPVAFALKSAFRNSDRMVAISSLAKSDAVSALGLEPEAITVTPLGADARFRPAKKSEPRPFTVGYVGGFSPHKNVQALIRAFARAELKDARLVLYGRGMQMEECRALAKRLGVANAEFKGYADDADLPAIYNSFDAFAFPSLSEGFGLPIIEAQRCGVPAITFGEARIPQEVTRACLKAKDEAHMAELMLLVKDKGFRFSEEANAHLSGFTWENCAKKTIEVYRQLI